MNTQIINEWRDATKSLLNEPMPRPVPVVEVNPKIVKNGIVAHQHQSTTGAFTIYTTPATQDFYLTGLSFSLTKNAACDSATGYIGIFATIGGATQYLASISTITLTAQDKQVSVEFAHPIKIDRSSTLRLGGVFTAGVMDRTAEIYGFLDEYSNA